MIGVSCIMPTANRRPFVSAAIELFLAQDYSNKELIIVDDGQDPVGDLIPCQGQIEYLALPQRYRLGTKRNIACNVASGDIIVHWDDDDWHAPWRLSRQVQQLESGGFDICGLDRAFFVDARLGHAWEYIHPRTTMAWVCGASLCYRKSAWALHPFADIDRAEDTRFVFLSRAARIDILENDGFLVARIHETNTCPKRPRDARWLPRPLEDIRALIEPHWQRYFGGPAGLPRADSET